MKILIFLLLSAAPFYAQEKPDAKPAAEPKPRVSRLVTVKYLEGSNFDSAIQLLRSFGASIEGRSSMRIIAVSGPPEIVTAVEDAIKRMDVAPPPPPSVPADKNVEVTFHIIMATNKPGDTKMPPDLDGVLKQMRGVFQYQSYKLLDTQLIRTRDRQKTRGENAELNGVLPTEKDAVAYSYYGQLYPSSTEDSRGRTFRLEHFLFQIRVKNNPNVQPVNIRTDIDVREGQKVVVGKSNLDSESTIFLVVSAKQVE